MASGKSAGDDVDFDREAAPEEVITADPESIAALADDEGVSAGTPDGAAFDEFLADVAVAGATDADEETVFEEVNAESLFGR